MERKFIGFNVHNLNQREVGIRDENKVYYSLIELGSDMVDIKMWWDKGEKWASLQTTFYDIERLGFDFHITTLYNDLK